MPDRARSVKAHPHGRPHFRRRDLFGKILLFLLGLAATLLIGVVVLDFVYLTVQPVSTLMLARWIRGEPVARL